MKFSQWCNIPVRGPYSPAPLLHVGFGIRNWRHNFVHIFYIFVHQTKEFVHLAFLLDWNMGHVAPSPPPILNENAVIILYKFLYTKRKILYTFYSLSELCSIRVELHCTCWVPCSIPPPYSVKKVIQTIASSPTRDFELHFLWVKVLSNVVFTSTTQLSPSFLYLSLSLDFFYDLISLLLVPSIVLSFTKSSETQLLIFSSLTNFHVPSSTPSFPLPCAHSLHQILNKTTLTLFLFHKILTPYLAFFFKLLQVPILPSTFLNIFCVSIFPNNNSIIFPLPPIRNSASHHFLIPFRFFLKLTSLIFSPSHKFLSLPSLSF